MMKSPTSSAASTKKLASIDCKIPYGFTGISEAVANGIYCGIHTMLSDVLAQQHTPNCCGPHAYHTYSASCHFATCVFSTLAGVPMGAIAASEGTGTNIACPTLALRGTLTAMYAPFTPGCGTWIVVPGDPGGTVMTVVGPAGTNGLEGAFQSRGARIWR